MMAQLSPLEALKSAFAGRIQTRPKTRKDRVEVEMIAIDKAENKESFPLIFPPPQLNYISCTSLISLTPSSKMSIVEANIQSHERQSIILTRAVNFKIPKLSSTKFVNRVPNQSWHSPAALMSASRIFTAHIQQRRFTTRPDPKLDISTVARKKPKPKTR
jgi:hypothetical protein